MKNCTQTLTTAHQPVSDAFVETKAKAIFYDFRKIFLPFAFLFLLIALSANVSAQLGVYNFTGTGSCPNQNPAVASQPANAAFSNYTTVNTGCDIANDVFQIKNLNQNNTIDLTQYNQFTITPGAGYGLTLSSLSFTQSVDQDPGSGSTTWLLRSSIDNYATDISSGIATTTSQTPVINLPALSFTNTGAVTFRLYILNANGGGTRWINDDVTINGSVVTLPADPVNPTSNSPQCSAPGVTMNFNGTPPSGETWYWQSSAAGTSTANSASTYTVTTSGTYYVRSQDNTILAWSAGSGSITVTITPTVGTPVFILGATSTRCQGAGAVTYSATATNNTGITYSLDANSISFGNTINATTGEVNYLAAWNGTSTITATANGCSGALVSLHDVTITPNVGTPAFDLGTTTSRCSGAATINYNATATNSTGITYSLDGASLTGGNTINSSTGDVTYAAAWSGTTVITATATGCNGPIFSTHTVTVSGAVNTPVFVLGSTSFRCKAAGSVTYAASSNNATSITYSLDNTSLTWGNTINSTTGVVNYLVSWSGTSTITAIATGCGGNATATHTVQTLGTVLPPTFAIGATATRCQGAQTITYLATSTYDTAITYSLDATTAAFPGNSINTATGAVTFAAAWSGVSTITASAAGCGGPKTKALTVTTNIAVLTPVFTLGSSSVRCKSSTAVIYTATAANTSGITYSIDAASISAGLSINPATGQIDYNGGFTGTVVITASAAGCGGPLTATHTAITYDQVATPVFALGSASSRCTVAGISTATYTATATNTTGITYSLTSSPVAANTINATTGLVTYVANYIGTATITASAASPSGCGGPKTATHTVTTNGNLATPVFTAGATTTRCQGAGTVTYTATAANNSGITYSLDATTAAFAGNIFNSSTGAVTYAAGWSGTSTITVTAQGCTGPKTATHTVTTTPSVTAPVFAAGNSSTRCQVAASLTYTATASNSTGITYDIDIISWFFGVSVNNTSGQVDYPATWNGTTTIYANASGCGGPLTSTHVVTVTATVGNPVFTSGATSTRCQGAATVTYSATASSSTGISYSLDATTTSFAGNTFNTSTGAVTYAASWTGTSTITATATGCNGPSASTHTVTTTPTVGTPVFTLGSATTRCQGAATVNYTTTATNSTGRTYSLDATTAAFAGNSINTSTGAVTYAAGWSGTTIITVTAAGCNGPSTAVTHTVTTTPTVGVPVFTSGATSTRCQGAGTVTYAATATNNTSLTYSLDAPTAAFAGNSFNTTTGVVTYAAGWSGTSIITATAIGCNGPKTATHTVTITPTVGTPVFTIGATSSRCQGATTITYAATATNNTSLTYSLDATTAAFAGNSFNTSTGAVTYAASWFGTSTITVIAAGCNGPSAAVTHTVTTNAGVLDVNFVLGASSTHCQGISPITYTATASNSSSITYDLDGPSKTAGVSINTSTGVVSFPAGWSGTSIVYANATGCNAVITGTHIITTTPTVGVPVFTSGTSTTRCQGAGNVTYTATASNNTGITYSFDGATAAFAGNSINASTGDVIYAAGWSGTTIITASATGCNGPKTSNHTVTITPTVGIPVFTAGSATTRCQNGGKVTYTATATNSTSITYDLDATTDAFSGNSINTSTGEVNYAAGWTGTSIITVTATGCNGPSTQTHTVTTTPTVGTPVFALGATSIRCQGNTTTAYSATATNTTGITYSLNGAASTAGNTIDPATGAVTFIAGWTSSTTVTATAAGCNGPKTATHTITTTPSVTTPVFTLGSASIRCQGAGIIRYTATASNTTGITYSLDPGAIAAGITVNSVSGDVTYPAGANGTYAIIASAAGCNGPKTRTHTVTITPTVGTPVFAKGPSSIRCQGGGSTSYVASASDSTGINYSLNTASITGGNTINSSTGVVTFNASWLGTTIITATATGCNGPVSSTHTVSITPTVGTAVFSNGITSSRCQGAGTVIYTATATNTTGITYAIDGTSSSAGNIINSATGELTYDEGWSGTTTVIALAAGCNGPSVSTHVVTVVPTVGQPYFAFGIESVRTQGAGTVTYTAASPASTGITYELDPASLAAGNTINTATGAVTWVAGWFGTSSITATAVGCNGQASFTHFVYINPSVVQTPLYLSAPGNILDRVDPVSANLTTTLQSVELAAGGTSSITYTQAPALCSDLVIKAQTIQVLLYLTNTAGTIPSNPAITAQLKYGSTNIITLINPVYNASSKILTWSQILGADVTIPAGQSISLVITTAMANSIKFKIDYHSVTKPSRISLLPVATFIDITSFNIYSAPYPGGTIRTTGNVNSNYYVRAVATTPFGYKDITGMDYRFLPSGTIVAGTCVDSTSCTRTYEYKWTTTNATGAFSLMATAKEGYENLIKNSDIIGFDICSFCPPVAVKDSAKGAGGSPILVNALANDYDPNNNMNLSTLSIITQPHNGSGFISNNTIYYLPNGDYVGRDTLVYQICDSTSLCAQAEIYFTVDPFLIDPCSDATRSHTYFIPFSENNARIALDSSTNNSFPSNNIRTVISLKMPYPGMMIVWDHWEDGYELNPLDPLQTTTKVWGDGNPYNGIAPGYSSDIIPAGGSIILDNTIPTNPRVAANIFYDGRDKIFASGQIAVTQVCGEPSIMAVQCMKTNVSSTAEFGTSFTIPVGQNFNSQDFRYTSLFIRAAQNGTQISIDKDNNGIMETFATLNEGEELLVNGSVLSGASIAASDLIGVELHTGGNDGYSSRDVPIFPATWYSNTYLTPVPTTHSPDTAVVMLYNSLSRPFTVNWSSGSPASGSILLPAKTVIRFPLAISATATYKFVNPTGESFTAIQMCDSYTPNGGGNSGVEYDWSFNLISQNRLTDFATVAWAPGSIDGTRNDNPVWVTPIANTTIYVKYNGNVSGSTGLLSPCGMRYDVSYVLNALNYKRLLDASDKDQSGLAVFTCDGTKLAAVYGEDASTAVTGNPSWDVGSTIQPFCKQKLIFANDDYARTLIDQAVTIPILLNDFGFLAVVDPTSVVTSGLLQPRHGTVIININGTVIYKPNPGYSGKDTFEYRVCTTPTPVVCDVATVYIDISSCPAPFNSNVIAGKVFLDINKDGVDNDGGIGIAGAKVYLYTEGNCNQIIDPNELKDSITVDQSGTYQFITYPEKFVADNFDGPGGVRTCADGSDGNANWLSNWSDINDLSVGFCNNSQTAANTDADIFKDAAFTNALRLKGPNVSATRSVDLTGAGYAFLSFSYRRKSASLTAGEDVIVQASKDNVSYNTVFTIPGDGTVDAGYVDIFNQDITSLAASATYIRFLTNANVDDDDTVYIDNVRLQFLKYPQCYITRLDSATIPTNYHTTTVLKHNLTATSSVTCLAPYSFGVSKNVTTLSGTLFNDANGVTDSTVNGTTLGNPSGATMYAYLTDTSGKVVNKTTVNAGNGSFSFTGVDVLSDFTLQLSAINTNVGDVPPGSAALTTEWITTGNTFGTNNLAGVGLRTNVSNIQMAVKTGILPVTGINFGIQRLPNSFNHISTIGHPSIGQFITLNGGINPDVLSGVDPEDYPGGGDLDNRSVIIDSIPNNAELYYNGVLITKGFLINSLDPSLLKVKITPATLGSTSIFFKYSYVDAAKMKDPSPATYLLVWDAALPADALVALVNLNGTVATVKWSTLSEQNTDYFILERSLNNNSFSATGNRVSAAGNSITKQEYQQEDNISSLLQNNTIYYRVKLIDIDGKKKYSNVVALKISKKPGVTIFPNPFHSSVTVSITTEKESVIDINLIDVNGRTLKSNSQSVGKGITQITIGDLEHLPAGVYLLEIVDKKAGTTYQKLLTNN